MKTCGLSVLAKSRQVQQELLDQSNCHKTYIPRQLNDESRRVRSDPNDIDADESRATYRYCARPRSETR